MPSIEVLHILADRSSKDNLSVHAPKNISNKGLIPTTRNRAKKLRDPSNQVLASRSKRGVLTISIEPRV
jgi:hypothetical protein